MKRVLRIPTYRRLLIAYTINDLAWAVALLALSALVYRRTGSAVGSAAFFLASQFGPALVAPPLVARVDQLAARIVLPALYAVEVVLFLVLAYLTTHFSLAPVLAVVVLDGTVATVGRALIKAATTAVLTPRGLLRQGNAVINAGFSICYMVGPAIAGAIVVAGGTQAAMFVNAAMFAAATFNLATTKELPAGVTGRRRSAGRLRTAVASVRRDTVLRAMLLTQCAAFVAFTIAVPVEVVFAQHTLHAGAGGYGAMLSAWGIGAVVASLAYARWLDASARVHLAASAGALGLGFVLMAASPTIAVAIVASAVAGSGNGVQVVAARTFVQERTPQSWMAIVMGLQEAIQEATPGVGIVIGGAIAALASPRAALAVAGAASVAATVAFGIVLRPAATRGTPAWPREGPAEEAGLTDALVEIEPLQGAANAPSGELPWPSPGEQQARG